MGLTLFFTFLCGFASSWLTFGSAAKNDDTIDMEELKALIEKQRQAWWFVGAIMLVGGIRFTLTLIGLPNAVTKFASMSAVILVACFYFGWKTRSAKERLIISYLVILPYMLVELIGLGYTWASGRETIFHAPEYALGSSINLHFWGHLVGGLTWEPAFIFLAMLIIRGVYVGATSLAKPRAL